MSYTFPEHQLGAMNPPVSYGFPEHQMGAMRNPVSYDFPEYQMGSMNNPVSYGFPVHHLAAMQNPVSYDFPEHQMGAMRNPVSYRFPEHQMGAMRNPVSQNIPEHLIGAMRNPVSHNFPEQQLGAMNPYSYPGLIGDDMYETDEFRMYSFKINKCPRVGSHDWTTCPFAHRGERANRRDPCKYKYVAVTCPDYDHDGTCPRGFKCRYSHGVFEYWLHPAKYRTRPCNANPFCARKVCFFAHAPHELRDESDAKRAHTYRVKKKEIDAVNSANSAGAVNSASVFPTTTMAGTSGSNDFLASLSGLTISDNHESGMPNFAFNSPSVVPTSTMAGTSGSNDFLASFNGLPISDNDESEMLNLDWIADLVN